MTTESHEERLMSIVRRLLADGRCGVDLPQNPDDAVEREEAFATAIYEAISDESHGRTMRECTRRLVQRFQWMSAVLDFLVKNVESEVDRNQEFDANEVTDPGGGGLTSASKT